MARTWSKYQSTIFDFVKTGSGNAIVKAVAGSGKTTTIVEALSQVYGTSIFLAFNKDIAEELKARGVNARTFHSLTYMPVTKFKGTKKVEPNKLRLLIKKHFTGHDNVYYGTLAAKLVGLARQTGVDCLVPDTEAVWYDIIEHHNIELESERDSDGKPITLARLVELSRAMLQVSNNSEMVDFDDLLYFAVKFGIQLPKFDYIFVDEAQDTNAIQRAILRMIMKKTSRLVAVGDPAQAIYGFRGADSESINLIKSEFNCVELPLTVSYRCGTKIVDYAQGWVSHIEAAPDAHEGEVVELGEKWNIDMLTKDDLVVCRTTKPLIALAYKCLIARKPVYVKGKEIGEGLKSQIIKMDATSIDDLALALGEWVGREVDKAKAKMQDDKAAAFEDKYDAIMCLINSMPEGKRTIPALLETIDELFRSKDDAVTLSTIHKAKGLESPVVFWLNSSQCPSKWAKLPWMQEQERNLCYVAVTRAIHKLVLIEDPKKKP